MKNNFYEIKDSMNFIIDSDESINFIDLNEKDEKIKIDFTIKNKIELFINFTILNFLKFHKSIDINIIFEHPNAMCKVSLNCLGINDSITNLAVNGISDQSMTGFIDINIEGIIDSDNAKIIGSPNFIFRTNKIDAHHSLTIGGINPFQLDFLQSRNITITDAKYLLVTSKLFKSLSNLDDNLKGEYQNKILSYWGGI